MHGAAWGWMNASLGTGGGLVDVPGRLLRAPPSMSHHHRAYKSTTAAWPALVCLQLHPSQSFQILPITSHSSLVRISFVALSFSCFAKLAAVPFRSHSQPAITSPSPYTLLCRNLHTTSQDHRCFSTLAFEKPSNFAHFDIRNTFHTKNHPQHSPRCSSSPSPSWPSSAPPRPSPPPVRP